MLVNVFFHVLIKQPLFSHGLKHTISMFSLAACALVDLRMEDTVEVYMDESAEIPCLYTFTEKPVMVMVQWFVVSPEGSNTLSHFLV